MPMSRPPQALQAPPVLLLWIAPSVFPTYTGWLSRMWGRLALLAALLLPPRRINVHIPSSIAIPMDYLRTILGIDKSPASNGLRSASRAPNRDKPQLFAVRRATMALLG